MKLKRCSRRAPWHDYRSRCIYMITVHKMEGAPNFSRIVSRETGLPDGKLHYDVELSEAGSIIRRAIYDTLGVEKTIKLLQYCIMPDHVHILLQVLTPLDKHLGIYILALKQRCNMQATLLSDGYNDQILTTRRKLSDLFNYIRDNPRRLALKRSKPQYFCSTGEINIAGTACLCYGNRFLLNNPFKDQVVVHRADTPATRQANRAIWEHTAGNGGVLVSPFISRDEREILAMAIEVGGNIIYITDSVPQGREKPQGRLFDLCAQGRLLLIAPAQAPSLTLTRQACLAMNALAASIAGR